MEESRVEGTGLGDELSGEADIGTPKNIVIKLMCVEDSWKVRLGREFGICLEGAGNMNLKNLNFKSIGNREP